jgi:hypothetical protein
VVSSDARPRAGSARDAPIRERRTSLGDPGRGALGRLSRNAKRVGISPQRVYVLVNDPGFPNQGGQQPCKSDQGRVPEGRPARDGPSTGRSAHLASLAARRCLERAWRSPRRCATPQAVFLITGPCRSVGFAQEEAQPLRSTTDGSEILGRSSGAVTQAQDHYGEG